MEEGLLVAVEPQGNGETIDNSQFTIHNFRASREQSRIHSDFAEAQPKIEANASIHN